MLERVCLLETMFTGDCVFGDSMFIGDCAYWRLCLLETARFLETVCLLKKTCLLEAVCFFETVLIGHCVYWTLPFGTECESKYSNMGKANCLGFVQFHLDTVCSLQIVCLLETVFIEDVCFGDSLLTRGSALIVKLL